MAREYVEDETITIALFERPRGEAKFSTRQLWRLRNAVPGEGGYALSRLIQRKGRTDEKDIAAILKALPVALQNGQLDQQARGQAIRLRPELKSLLPISA